MLILAVLNSHSFSQSQKHTLDVYKYKYHRHSIRLPQNIPKAIFRMLHSTWHSNASSTVLFCRMHIRTVKCKFIHFLIYIYYATDG